MNNTDINILVVEDESSLRDMMVMVLEDEDYQVHSAENGYEAWEQLNNQSYDLLITDLFMPQMNGFELSRKCQETFPSTKIILLSGGGKELEATEENNVVAFEDKQIIFDAYLKKPYNLNTLLSIIEKLLDN